MFCMLDDYKTFAPTNAKQRCPLMAAGRRWSSVCNLPCKDFLEKDLSQVTQWEHLNNYKCEGSQQKLGRNISARNKAEFLVVALCLFLLHGLRPRHLKEALVIILYDRAKHMSLHCLGQVTRRLSQRRARGAGGDTRLQACLSPRFRSYTQRRVLATIRKMSLCPLILRHACRHLGYKCFPWRGAVWSSDLLCGYAM